MMYINNLSSMKDQSRLIDVFAHVFLNVHLYCDLSSDFLKVFNVEILYVEVKEIGDKTKLMLNTYHNSLLIISG